MILNSSTVGVKVKQNGAFSIMPGVRVKQGGNITTVWVAATPYTVVFTDYPLVEVSSEACASKTCETTATHYRISALKGETVTFASIKASATLPTQKCNKVKVKYSASEYAGGSINGVEITAGATDQYMTFDCSGDEFELVLSVWDNTAYYAATLTISEVSFYHEL